MTYNLRLVTRTPGTAPSVPVDGAVTIGRAPDADLTVPDDYASNRHARVFEKDGQLFVEDMGSTNGIYVNGARVYVAALHGGDVIRVGQCSVEVLAPALEIGGYL